MLNKQILFVEDRFHVSGQAYHELAKICRALPRHWRIKERIAELNRLWNIRSTPNGTVRVQQSLEDRLLICLEQLQCVAATDAEFRRTKTIKVKLSGDGTNIGKHLYVILTFTLKVQWHIHIRRQSYTSNFKGVGKLRILS